MHADRVSVDLASKQLEAQGGVVLDQGPRRLAGDTLRVRSRGQDRQPRQRLGLRQPGLLLQGKKIAKIGDDTYTVTDGVFTSCAGDSPPWSFRVSSARVEVESYAHVRNATLRVQEAAGLLPAVRALAGEVAIAARGCSYPTSATAARAAATSASPISSPSAAATTPPCSPTSTAASTTASATSSAIGRATIRRVPSRATSSAIRCATKTAGK